MNTHQIKDAAFLHRNADVSLEDLPDRDYPLARVLPQRDAIDWGNRITWVLCGFMAAIWTAGLLIENWEDIHMLNLMICFVACVVAGIYLAVTPRRKMLLKWAITLGGVFALGFLAL